ncbi:fibronectin type III domain-containing protein [Actinoplanes aureus]|uniref:Fibronectin type III domain-containing protein n=1 Tax=Actinoplanes aureus TaxID=2792083 RepID=A0A931G848_9ACTN|nr:fibronectin type III domain-containing protein [Actinoplanes aureus]MBG0568889.1 fibronectin type III domain-containing protein [Actinoplanes aureus]
MLGYRKRSAVALSAIVVPLLLAGCGSAAKPVEEEATGGAEWMLVEEGRATPSPTVKPGKPWPTPSETLPTLPAASNPPAATPSSTCTPRPRVGDGINALGVVPGSTSAQVTWYHPGGGNIVDYRVTAISQDLQVGTQREVGWTKAVPVKCGDMTTTVTGLEPGTPYVFSLDVVMTQTGLEGVTTSTVARSQVVSTT